MRDPDGANLDRIQIIKGWLNESGQTEEKVFNVVWSNAKERALNDDGVLVSVGSTVDEIAATYDNTIGASALRGILARSQFRSHAACLLLCAGDGNPHAPMAGL
jgi:hypothetical protein